VDMGYYQWEADSSLAGDEEEGGPTNQVLHLVQVQGQQLAARLRLFPWPLPAAVGDSAMLKQILPGFWDAPGGKQGKVYQVRLRNVSLGPHRSLDGNHIPVLLLCKHSSVPTHFQLLYNHGEAYKCIVGPTCCSMQAEICIILTLICQCCHRCQELDVSRHAAIAGRPWLQSA
jgi:hypothetical protein